MTKRWLSGRFASSICATALGSPRKASVRCAPRSVIGPGFAATSPRKMRTPRSSEYVIENESGRATTSAFSPAAGRAAVAGRGTGALWVTCASCVASVEDALRGVAGVRAADVNLATERARVELDPARALDSALVRAIERAGYGALVLSADRAERAVMEERERAVRAAYLTTLRRRLVVAAALAVPALLLSMGDLAFPQLAQVEWRGYVLFLLATPVQLWSALPFYRR